jgi:hypothetical protein
MRRPSILIVLVLLGIAALSGRAEAFTPTPIPTPTPNAQCGPDGAPRIFSVEPATVAPYSSVTVKGCNLFGEFPDTCDASVGGVQAYIEGTCGEREWSLIIPIAATHGPIVLTIYGVQTEPFAYELLAQREYGPWNIVEGYISVGVRPTVDFLDVMASVGSLAGSISPNASPFCYKLCYYTPAVPVGQEVASAIAYYADPRVLWAQPEPVACIPEDQTCGKKPTDTPTPSASPLLTPARLPESGGPPHPESAPGWIELAIVMTVFATMAGWRAAKHRSW